jgi:hypothetical protein
MAYTTIDDPSAYFQTDLYTGTGSSLANTFDGNSDMQPDWVWIKERNGAADHALYDSSRGVQEQLESNTTTAETTEATGLTAFGSDGFTVGALAQVNTSSDTYVAWGWKANGGTTASNTDGDITSTVQVNSDAGFSIVTDSPPNNTARSIGHGLGVAPQVIIRRARNRVENWRVFHSAAGSTGALMLDNADAYNSSIVLFTGVTSTTFGVGTDFSVNGNFNYISYCFAEVQGYSKFSSYVGNGVANNGPFVYLGFKPRFLMIKSTTATGSHVIWDSKRSPFNGMDDYLVAAEADAEGTNGIFTIDAVSNGFKIMNTGANNGLNQSGTKYVYYAWAENPFTTSTGIPATAR